MAITREQKELAILAIREHGTMKAGASAAGVTVRTLNEEMRRAAIFKRRVSEARAEGKLGLSDNALQLVKDYAEGLCVFCHGAKKILGEQCPLCEGSGLGNKTDRNRLTAALSLLNWVEPGFRGTTTVQGKIDHDIRVITAVPRPKYLPKIEALGQSPLDNPSKNMLKSGKKVIIEGEVINES